MRDCSMAFFNTLMVAVHHIFIPNRVYRATISRKIFGYILPENKHPSPLLP